MASFSSDEVDGKGDKLADEHEINVKENQHTDSCTIVNPYGAAINNKPVLESTEENTRSTGKLVDVVVQEEYFCSFPDLPVKNILKFTKENKTLLNSRLVCTQWNNIIQDTSELMSRIVFYVSNLQEFVELPTVKEGKVKSIVIKTSAPSEHIDIFVASISSSVENVTFTLKAEKLSSILKLVLETCSNLKVLRLYECSGVDGLSANVIKATKIRAATKINILSINVIGFKVCDVPGISTLIGKLPVLKELEFIGHCDIAMASAIILALNAYLKKKSTGALKKLSLKAIHNVNTKDIRIDSPLNRLFLLCGQHGINMQEIPPVNLEWLLKLDEQIFYSVLNGPLLLVKSRLDGLISFYTSSYLTNLDRLHFFTVRRLGLVFIRFLVQEELSSWLGNLLPDVEELRMQGFGTGIPTTNELNATFATGYFSLKSLTIYQEVFNSIHVLRLPQYFPNLNELYFNRCKITPNNLIAELTTLESLTKLGLLYLPNLADVAFTIECVEDSNCSGACNNATAGPAIASFKSLKFLHLDNCSLLTNNCVTHGIAKSKTLNKVVISGCSGINKQDCGLIKCKVVYR